MKTQAAIQSFLNNRQAQNLSPETIKWYQSKLGIFARFHPKFPRKPEPIEEFLTNLNVCPETKYTYFRALRSLYRFISQRYVINNPMAKIVAPRHPKKVMPTLEPREIMGLISSASNLRDRVLVTLFADTGARVSEIATLRKQDIADDTITVKGKTGQREIPISEETRRLLLAQIATDAEGEFVFSGRPSGRPLSREGVYLIIKALMKKAGIQGPKLGPHRIRHAFGKCYLVAGGDVRSLQELMGHANIATTEKYAALALSDIIDKHHKFTPLRAAHAAAQESFFDTSHAIKEAEAILKGDDKHARCD